MTEGQAIFEGLLFLGMITLSVGSMFLTKVYDTFISYCISAFAWIAFLVYALSHLIPLSNTYSLDLGGVIAVLSFFSIGMIIALILGGLASNDKRR